MKSPLASVAILLGLLATNGHARQGNLLSCDAVANQTATPEGENGGTGEAAKNSTSGAGNPVDMTSRAVRRHEVDINIPVRYGMALRIDRTHSEVTNYDVAQAIGIYGHYWTTSMQACLQFVSGDPYNFIDESGATTRLFEDSTDVWNNRLTTNEDPIEMVATSTEYILTRPDRSQLIFHKTNDDLNGQLKAIELDSATTVEERITFDYKDIVVGMTTLKMLHRIKAPGAATSCTDCDDRYLELTYWDEVDPYTTLNFRVQSIALRRFNDSGFIKPLVFYDYDNANDDMLTEVRYNADGSDYARIYEYGSWDGSALSGSTTGNRLGRVSYTLDPGTGLKTRPLSVYSFDTSAFTATGNWSAVDPDAGSISWTKNVTLDSGVDGYGLPYINVRKGSSSSGNKQLTIQFNSNNYGNQSSYTTDFDSSVPKIIVERYSSHPDYFQKVVRQKQEVTGGSPVTKWENTYNFGSGTFLDKTRLASRVVHSSSTVSHQTDITYHGTFTHKPTEIENPAGEDVDFTYFDNSGSDPTSKYGRLKTIVRQGVTTTFDYYHSNSPNPNGMLKSVQTPDGTTTYTYDARGNLLTTTTPDGNVVTRTYDLFSNVKTVTATNLGTWTYTYSNELSTVHAQYFLPPRLVKIQQPNSEITEYEYDSSGNLLTLTDERANVTNYFYDARNRLAQIENAKSEDTLFGYDVMDRLTSYTDGLSNATTYTYDDFGRVKKETLPGSPTRETTYAYAADSSCGNCGSAPGLVSQITRADSSTVSFAYDRAGRLTSVDYSDIGGGPEVAYDYDAAHRVTSVEDTRLPFTNNVYDFSYDAEGRLDSVAHPEGYTQEYGYDNDGRVDWYKDVDGNVVDYQYDGYGRLSTLVDGYGSSTVWTYAAGGDTSFPRGSIKKVTYGNSTSQNPAYDNMARLTQLAYKTSSGSFNNIITLDFSYIENDLIEYVERTTGTAFNNKWKSKFQYDELNRLVREDSINRILYDPDDPDAPSWYREYAYDAGGNRSSYNFNGGTAASYTYNARNELQSTGSYDYDGTSMTGTTAFAWDAKGNMDYRRYGSTGGYQEWNYSWNEDNKLTGSTYTDWVSGYSGSYTTQYSVSYKYDYMGRRILKQGTGSDANVRTRFFFHGLTEEVKKQSVGTHTDTSFEYLDFDDGDSTTGWSQFVGSGGTVSVASADSGRKSDVLSFSHASDCTVGFKRTVSGATIKRVASMWVKRGVDCGKIAFRIRCTDGEDDMYYYPTYHFTTGTNGQSGTTLNFYIGSTPYPTGSWARFQRDIEADVEAMNPSWSYVNTDEVRVYHRDIKIDDIRFSNALTVEHNTLGPGVIGHILRHRTTNPTTYAATDRWFLYDQVGSVIAHTASNQTVAQTNWQDAWGNTLASMSTGYKGGTKSGWHHNTM